MQILLYLRNFWYLYCLDNFRNACTTSWSLSYFSFIWFFLGVFAFLCCQQASIFVQTFYFFSVTSFWYRMTMDYKVLASLHQPERGVKCGNMKYNKKKRIRIRFRKINYELLLKMVYHIKWQPVLMVLIITCIEGTYLSYIIDRIFTYTNIYYWIYALYM
jgi:hypothetical protein